MSRAERNELVANNSELRIEYSGAQFFNIYNLFYNNQLIIHNSIFKRKTIITPTEIQLQTRIRRATQFNWSIEYEGRTYTARDIELMTMQERLELPFVRNGDITFSPFSYDRTGEAWINIVDHRNDLADPIVATIDYSAPTNAIYSG